MTCNFRVGQKVVCISAAHNAEAHEAWSRSRGFDVRYPVVGATYTIREVFLHESGVIALRFRELVNPALPYANKVSELAMDARHFRPVAERGTDLGHVHPPQPPEQDREARRGGRMSWLIYGIIGFTILCGATALAYALADRDDGRGESSGAPEGDQVSKFGQRSPSC